MSWSNSTLGRQEEREEGILEIHLLLGVVKEGLDISCSPFTPSPQPLVPNPKEPGISFFRIRRSRFKSWLEGDSWE
jgi:hypothetical protein